MLLGKVLENTLFDGCLPLFFIGIPIIITIMISFSENQVSLLYQSLNKIQKGEKLQKQIKFFLELIDKKEFDRDSKIILQGYITIYEESCNIQECALKKYIYNLEFNNIDTIGFLIQHAETLYQNGISKFPSCTSLRITYAFFLLERLNKKQQANIELINAEKYKPSFEEQFMIYRYKKMIEEQSSNLGDNEENLDVVSNIAYKIFLAQCKINYLKKFLYKKKYFHQNNKKNLVKASISKIATLYTDFWNLLINPNQENQEDLAKLNDYGSKINVLVEEINNLFEKMQKIKHNDQEVIKYYSDFLSDILNNKEKSQSYKSRLTELEGDKLENEDINFLSGDSNVFSQNDDCQYIIISAQPEKIGIIRNLSLGICTLFGYTKSELIGKNIE